MLRSVFDTVIENVPLMVSSFAIRLEYAVLPVVRDARDRESCHGLSLPLWPARHLDEL